ncbi:MAG TPA: hypothetical protein VEC37_04245 [Bacillota bacterium]|nr:hypothetical protein [Bacillota bacterium]
MFNPQKGFTAALVGSIAHLIIGTFCGLLFTHYLKATTFQNILTKGAFFGAFLWVSFLGAGSVFRLPIFTHVPPLSALLIFLNSLIYGFVTAYVLSKFSLAQPSK